MLPWLFTCVLISLQIGSVRSSSELEPEDAYIDEDLLTAKVIQDIPISDIEEFAKFNDLSMLLKT